MDIVFKSARSVKGQGLFKGGETATIPDDLARQLVLQRWAVHSDLSGDYDSWEHLDLLFNSWSDIDRKAYFVWDDFDFDWSAN